MSASNTGKDVVYIDVDEEITGIIDKIRSSEQRIVALVLPKRATAMQSIVNMKLLKRTADESKKHVVLITSDTGLLPLAGNVGLYVARNLQSRPEIPNGPDGLDDTTDEVEEPAAFVGAASGVADDAAKAGTIDKTKPIGQFAGASAIAARGGEPEEDETIELDDEPEAKPADAAAGKTASKAKGPKGFKIPDFNKFRLWLALGCVGVVLIGVALYAMFVVMPKASIAIKTDSSAINAATSIKLAASSDATLDKENLIAPAVTVETTKTLTQQADASGQVDKGTKARGRVTITNCKGGEDLVIPAGTAVSSGGLTFITQEEASMSLESASCKSTALTSDTVDVVAIAGGEKYNIAATSFTVANHANTTKASSSAAMAGGTTNIVKVINQSDIDAATQKIGQQDTTSVKQELARQLNEKNTFVIEDTFKAGEPVTTTSAKAGDEATSVTVTQKIKYTMMGAKEDDIKKLIAEEISSKIDTKKQSILDYGLKTATFSLQTQDDSGTVLGMSSKVIVGSDLDQDAIKKQVAGKKSSEARDLIKEYPGVTDVQVTYSPFWVSSIPGKTDKITVQIQEPTVTDDTAE